MTRESVLEKKEQHPEQFCSVPGCLWTVLPACPCPIHGVRTVSSDAPPPVIAIRIDLRSDGLFWQPIIEVTRANSQRASITRLASHRTQREAIRAAVDFLHNSGEFQEAIS